MCTLPRSGTVRYGADTVDLPPWAANICRYAITSHSEEVRHLSWAARSGDAVHVVDDAGEHCTEMHWIARRIEKAACSTHQ